MVKLKGLQTKKRLELTKYVVGEKANPPKNPRSPPKKGKLMPTNIVNAAIKYDIRVFTLQSSSSKYSHGS